MRSPAGCSAFPPLSVPKQLLCVSVFDTARFRIEVENGGFSYRNLRDKKVKVSKGAAVRYAATGRTDSTESRFRSPLPLRDFYELLDVPVEASPEEIRRAYRGLQKKHHPDVVGVEEQLLARGLVRTGHKIFVDENVCVGCQKCVDMASSTFVMDANTGVARVRSQWADTEFQVKSARESCPVNCIHYVEREVIPILEYLIRPQRKQSNGVYGGGWERPSNVFVAARTMKRQMKEQQPRSELQGEEETPAQRKARMEADLQLRIGPFWKLWSWMSTSFSAGSGIGNNHSHDGAGKDNVSWKGLFGWSSESDVLILRLSRSEVPFTVALVQEWASTFASSSEIPLPMPFRADLLSNGVELSFITANNGVIFSIGSLVVTVEEALAPEDPGLQDRFPVDEIGKEEAFLRVRRLGTTGTFFARGGAFWSSLKILCWVEMGLMLHITSIAGQHPNLFLVAACTQTNHFGLLHYYLPN